MTVFDIIGILQLKIDINSYRWYSIRQDCRLFADSLSTFVESCYLKNADRQIII